MARTKNPNKLASAEAAWKLGMSKECLQAELQRDAQRPPNERKYWFANPVQSDITGTWSYNINAAMLEEYMNCKPQMDYDLLAEKLAPKLASEIAAILQASSP